jgi:hypothetical protein
MAQHPGSSRWVGWTLAATTAIAVLYAGSYAWLRLEQRFVHYALDRFHDAQGRSLPRVVVDHAIDDGGRGPYGNQQQQAAAQSDLLRLYRPLAWVEAGFWAVLDDDQTQVACSVWAGQGR